jgi:hypothetical protein
MGSEFYLVTAALWVPSLIYLLGMLVKLISVPIVTEARPAAETA